MVNPDRVAASTDPTVRPPGSVRNARHVVALSWFAFLIGASLAGSGSVVVRGTGLGLWLAALATMGLSTFALARGRR